MKALLATLKHQLPKLLFFVPVALGVAAVVWAVASRSEPERVPEQELARALRVLEVQPTEVVPRAVGYGEADASQFFQAVAEVKGKIVDLHPELKAGSFIREGELLVAIDITDTQIAIQKLKAEIARSEASLSELTASGDNLESALKIEQASLEVAKGELERLQQLEANNNVVSKAEVDQQRRSVLAQQQAVQNLNNSLNLLPAQIESAEATIAVAEANLVSSERDLERCRIKAPFNCRLGPVDLELDEFVAVGQQLFTAQSIDKIEVEAQFSLPRVANLLRPGAQSPQLSDDPSAPPQEILRNFFALDATVRYGSSGFRASREADFERLREQLDSQARTVGIVVSIDKPFDREGDARVNGPPPVPGTYCEVELRAEPLSASLIVPRAAIHDGNLFVLDADNRLRRRAVEIALTQNDFSVIATGLSAGERVVVSDPTPAIEGMLVSPELDTDLAEALRLQAGPSRGEKGEQP